MWGADGGVAEYVMCDKVRDECEARYIERRTGRTNGSCAVRGCAGEEGELQPLSLMGLVQRVAVVVGLVASVAIGFGLVQRRQEKADRFRSLERAYRVRQPPNSREPAVQVPAVGSSDAMKWQGWTQSNGPQTKLSASDSSYWGRAGTELLASAKPEGSGRRLAAEPLSVIIVETDDDSRHFEFLQMTKLASSGIRFRAKTPEGWRTRVVAGAEWEQLLRMAGRAGTEER